MAGVFGIDPNRPYNKNCYLCAHNCYSARQYGWLYYQQDMTVYEQLRHGARALMPDIWVDNGDIYLLHEGKLKSRLMKPTGSFMRYSEFLMEVKRFLDENPREVVTLIHESYVTDKPLMEKALADAGVQDLIFWQDGRGGCKDCRDQVWPTLNELADMNKRLVLFTYKWDSDGLPFQWDYLIENKYGDEGLNPETWANHRSDNYPLNCPKALFCMNHFPSVGFNLLGKFKIKNVTETCNDCNNILAHAEACKAASGINRLPNFVAVDMVEGGINGGPGAAVAALNAQWAAVP